MKNKRDVTDCLDDSKSQLWSIDEHDDQLEDDDPFEALYIYLSSGDHTADELPQFIEIYGFEKGDPADDPGYFNYDCTEFVRIDWREWAAKEEPELLEDLS